MQDKRIDHKTWIKYIVVFFYPILLCLLYCNVRGISFGDIYLPNSDNNDVLFYFKQVEGILSYGVPQGFFGYNEAHALIGSFATWNPILFLPWIIFGMIFGWNYITMTFCNILLFSITLVIYVKLSDMDTKGVGISLVLFTLYPSLPLHLISGMVETNVLCMVLIFFASAINWAKGNHNRRNLIVMVVVSSILTICRPFMLILVLLPCMILFQRKTSFYRVCSVIIIIVNIISYWMYSHFFSSPYYEGMFDTEMFEELFRGNLAGFFARFSPILNELWFYVVHAFNDGNTAGCQYLIAFITAIVLIYSFFKHKDSRTVCVNITYVVMILGLVAATLLIGGKVNEGGRHIYSFSVCGILLCANNYHEKKIMNVNLVLVVCLVWFLKSGSLVPDDYDIPIYNEKLAGELEYWEDVYQRENIVLSKGLSYDNTLMWVMFDWNGVEAMETDYKQLYNFPKGFGISCCTQSYIIENWNELKSKYMMTLAGGYIEELCIQMGYKELGRTEDMVFYCRY